MHGDVHSNQKGGETDSLRIGTGCAQVRSAMTVNCTAKSIQR